MLKTAVQRAVNLWHSWQGTYTFAIIAALRPSIITERITFIQTFILLGIFTVGFWYFCQVMLHRLLGLSKACLLYTSKCLWRKFWKSWEAVSICPRR